MAITDRWQRKDKTPTDLYGQGLRYRVQLRGHPARSFRTLGEAQRYELKLKTEPRQVELRLVTMSELVDRWYAGKAGLTRSSRYACSAARARVKEQFGDQDPRELLNDQIKAWVVSLNTVDGNPAKYDTKAKALQAVAGALKIAKSLGLVQANEAEGITIPKGDQRAARFLTASELKQLGLAAGRYRSLVLFLGMTGMRVGEAAALTIGDIDVKRARAQVRKSKNGKPRSVPIPAAVVKMLDLKRGRDERVFLSPTGLPISVHNFRERDFADAVKAAKLGDLHIHDLRHTAASLMIQSGATVLDVQNALGHDNATMTLNLYSHWWDTGLDDVSRRMNALLTSR